MALLWIFILHEFEIGAFPLLLWGHSKKHATKLLGSTVL